MTNIEKSYRRMPVSIWNQIARITGQDRNWLSIDSLLDTAVKKAGLTDFGNTSFIEPLSIIVNSINASRNIHPFGRLFAKQMIISSLCNRLYIEKEWSQHPELNKKSIKGNLTIMGLPRTGTSYLFNLLSCDANHRYLSNWEAIHPIFPERKSHFAKKYSKRIRRLLSALEIHTQQYLSPSLPTIHEYRVDGPEECTRLFFNEFACQALDLLFDMPNYKHWLENYDYIPAMRYHMRQLIALDACESGKRWVLKSPYYLPAIDALLNLYSESTVIIIHRDPLEVLPSFCSLTAAYRGICNENLNRNEIGREAIDFSSHSLDRAMAARKKHAPDRFIDVYYKELINNPLKVIEKIYSHLGMEVSKETEKRIKAEGDASVDRRGKFHRYSLDQFGLERKDICNRFDEYIETFNLT